MSIDRSPSVAQGFVVRFTANDQYGGSSRMLPRGGYSITAPSNCTYIVIGSGMGAAAQLTGNSAIFLDDSSSVVTIKIISGAPCSLRIEPLESDVLSVGSLITADVITSSTTYTQTGAAVVVLVGGGQAGTQVPGGGAPGGTGGRGGNYRVINTFLPGNAPVVVGAGGLNPGGLGGDSSFNGISTSGGVQGGAGAPGGIGPGQVGLTGTPGQSTIDSYGATTSLALPGITVGAAGAGGSVGPGAGLGGAGGGGFVAGGGGGGSSFPPPPNAPGGPGGGGGGGGYFAGGGGSPGTPGKVGGVGGSGGAGGVIIFRRSI